MNELAKVFVSHHMVAELEKRMRMCEGRNDQAEKLLGDHDMRLNELEAFYKT